VAGLASSFGSGAMTNSINEIEQCEVALIIGSNTTENHPIIGSALRRAVQHNKTKIIIADPRRINLVNDSYIWLRQQPGTDLALINGLIHVILEEKLHNKNFIKQRTENFEQLASSVEKYTPSKVENITNIPAVKIKTAARLYATAKHASIFYAMGITQHTSGTNNVMGLANLAMICGHIGKPGSGVNPLRGQNNVQGACDMGGLPNFFPGYQKITNKETLKYFKKAWNIETLPNNPGLTLTEIMQSAHNGSIKGLFILGENPMVSDPNTSHVEKSLEQLDLLIVQDIFLTETASLADIVFPGACWAEKNGTFTNTERRIQLVRKAVNPPGEAKTDGEILNNLAQLLNPKWQKKEPKQIFEEISKNVSSYSGVNYERLEKEGGLQWPCTNENHPGTPILHTTTFTRGKGLFHALKHTEPVEKTDVRYPFVLTTGRNLYHYHTRTMTGRSIGFNELAPKCKIEINPKDAVHANIKNGDLIQISSRRGKILATVDITERVNVGVVFLPFHYAEAAANVLTIGAIDPIAKIPELKVCAVQLNKVL